MWKYSTKNEKESKRRNGYEGRRRSKKAVFHKFCFQKWKFSPNIKMVYKSKNSVQKRKKNPKGGGGWKMRKIQNIGDVLLFSEVTLSKLKMSCKNEYSLKNWNIPQKR